MLLLVREVFCELPERKNLLISHSGTELSKSFGLSQQKTRGGHKYHERICTSNPNIRGLWPSIKALPYLSATKAQK